MVARVWSAQTTPGQSPAYVGHLRTQVLPALRKISGYVGSRLLERTASGKVEIIVITFWQSIDSIRAFAGDDVEMAVVAHEAAAVLTRFDRRVRHYEVVLADEVQA